MKTNITNKFNTSSEKNAKTKRKIPKIIAFLAITLIGILLFLLIFNTFYEISHPVSFSMMPTIIDGDTVLCARTQNCEQFDVILCKLDIVNPTGRLIKRVVAVGGQWIEIKNNLLYITEIVDGEEVVKVYSEPYVTLGNITLKKTFVREGRVFLLGDNRPFSYDSEEFGSIDENRVVARVILRDVGKPVLISTQFPER